MQALQRLIRPCVCQTPHDIEDGRPWRNGLTQLQRGGQLLGHINMGVEIARRNELGISDGAPHAAYKFVAPLNT